MVRAVAWMNPMARRAWTISPFARCCRHQNVVGGTDANDGRAISEADGVGDQDVVEIDPCVPAIHRMEAAGLSKPEIGHDEPSLLSIFQ
jgi:hypothetical protein